MKLIKNISIHLLRSIVGIVFIFSAYAKINSIDYFEIYVLQNGFFIDWNAATFLARLIVSGELFLGIMLLLNLKTNFIIKITLALMFFFTLLLVYIYFFISETSNCQCFGESVKLNPIESILKNLLLIILLIVLLKFNKCFNFRLSKLVLILMVPVSIAIPFSISPPDLIYNKLYPEESVSFKTRKLNVSKFGKTEFSGKHYDLTKGKYIVCFYSLACKYCKLSAKKMTAINNSMGKNLPILYVFLGKEENLNAFWEETESEKFPYKFLTSKNFLSLSGPSLPSIFLVKDGNIIANYGYRDITDKEVRDLLSDK